MEEDRAHKGRIRLWMYWITSIVATLILLYFVFIMMMVPGVLPSAKLWMLSIAAVALVVPLGVGLWKVSTTEAPFAAWPLGPIMGVILLLELTLCIFNIFLLLTKRLL
jgi:hypothetical protein